MSKIEKEKINWQTAILFGIVFPPVIINLLAYYFKNSLSFSNDWKILYSESFFTALSLLAGLVLIIAFKKRTIGLMIIIGGLLNTLLWFTLMYWYAHSKG